MHICTKLRNRLLSNSSSLIMGSFRISIKDVENLIEMFSKVDHNLVYSDIYVKDRQNYVSCTKISSNNVLHLLDQNTETYEALHVSHDHFIHNVAQ